MNFVTQKRVAPRLLTSAFTIAALAVSSCTSNAQTTAAPVAPTLVTPADWFKSQTAPIYKSGHTLPRLTRFGWDLDVDTFKELAERWNYAVQLNYTGHDAVNLIKNDLASFQARMVALTLSNPKKYPLAVILDRSEPADQVDAAFLHDADGKLINDQKIYSPIAPQIAYDKMAALRADPLRELRKKVPIDIVLNGGEYGLGVLGFMRQHAEKDPEVMAAKGDQDWFDFISKAKGLETNTIADAVRKAVPDRSLYILYGGGSIENNRFGGWKDWSHDATYTLGVGADLTSNEYYYKHFNLGYLPGSWDGNDMLTRALNGVGFQIAHDQKNSYDWVTSGYVDGAEEDAGLTAPVAAPVAALTNGGQAAPQLQGDNVAALVDPNAGQLSPMDLYTGFLKCLFTTGTLGANAGYYAFPTGGFDASFPADKPRQWAMQMARLSHVQALFSYLEEDLREGDLLTGGNFTAEELTPVYDGGINQTNPVYKGRYFPTNGHRWSHDQPAYELPTVANDFPNVRIVARKTTIGESSRWLVTAWAADGNDHDVEVVVPELGKIAMTARAAGSVYRATLQNGQPVVTLLDPEAMTPTSDPTTLAILKKMAGNTGAQSAMKRSIN